METKLLLKKIEKLSNELDSVISKIEKEVPDVIRRCEHALMEIDEIIRQVKAMITEHLFEDMAQEIYFFKEMKPKLIAKFIYYSKILDLESTKPTANLKTIKKHYETALMDMKFFYSQNLEFYNYYRRKATYLDHKYFVRHQYDLKAKFQTNLHNFDENFTTANDDWVARIIANDLLEKYILFEIENIGTNKEKNCDCTSKLEWSSPKVNLIELIYALHQAKCFNNGNIELNEIIRHSEKFLNIDLSSFYKTLGEIKGRKINRTKFLHFLNNSLDAYFIEKDA